MHKAGEQGMLLLLYCLYCHQTFIKANPIMASMPFRVRNFLKRNEIAYIYQVFLLTEYCYPCLYYVDTLYLSLSRNPIMDFAHEYTVLINYACYSILTVLMCISLIIIALIS